MKKTIIFAAAALVTMTACNKTLIETPMTDPNYGYINLGVSANTEMSVVTKGTTPDYYVKLVKVSGTETETNVWVNTDANNTYTFYDTDWVKLSEVNSVTDAWKVEAGNYKIYAKSHLSTATYEGKGEVIVEGVSENNIVVTPGVATSHTVTCKPVNSKVSFMYTPAFNTVFNPVNGDTFSVTASGDSRNVQLNMIEVPALEQVVNHDVAYFDADATISWSLNVKIGTQTETKTYNGTFVTKKAKWSQVTFTTGSTDGQVNLTIVVNGEIADVIPVPVTIDPITGDVNNQ